MACLRLVTLVIALASSSCSYDWTVGQPGAGNAQSPETAMYEGAIRALKNAGCQPPCPGCSGLATTCCDPSSMRRSIPH